MNSLTKYLVCTLSVPLLMLSSCRDKKFEMFNEVKGSYFSINQYIIDEWQSHLDDKFTLVKTVKLNDKVDSSYTNFEKVDWRTVLKVFQETDISNRKFLGKYTFSQFDDNFDNTRNYMYVANNEDLFTQKLLITISLNNNKVRGIFIETTKSNYWSESKQKLYYSPVRTIQIQQYDRPLLGGKKDLLLRYDVIERVGS